MLVFTKCWRETHEEELAMARDSEGEPRRRLKARRMASRTSVEFLADVFCKEPQDEVAVLLQQLVLAAVATVRNGIRQVLRAIQLHGDARVGTQEIDLQRARAVEGESAV